MLSSQSASESEASESRASSWKPWTAMADLAEAVDDLICSFDYMDTAMDNLVMLVFIWMVLSIAIIAIAKWAYGRFAKKTTDADKPKIDETKKTTNEIVSSADSVLATSAKVKSASFKPTKATGFVPATPPNKKRLGRMSPGPEQLTVKKHQSVSVPTCTGGDQPSVQWVNDVLTWLYNDLVIVNELVQQWISSMNEFSKKSVEEEENVIRNK
ncbi:uncharacterized protein LOC114241086 [Bombyx mandarina]|uniref:Uncharacterized protein LOC114241086 n=1 Tax=Bombyx mandarina TaxID=7092 RepID=A0A6J2JE65_BOMMA|nr:uncharacterized protein LOC114241086 [Bombyx mandarina]XP_028027629.1 uncharacterized protein LOC114241086 [Bombyx mandarina]